MLLNARVRARRAGVPFNLTEADIHIPSHCPVLGIPLIRGGNNESSPTLDRIVPAKGYVRGNVVVISRRANTIKADASAQEVTAVARWMESLGL